MTKIRNCNSNKLITGVSKCPYDFRKVRGALIVPEDYVLSPDITGEGLEMACHAEDRNRIKPIFGFVEYATNGGEVQVSAVGYGANKASDVSTRTDTFTRDEYSEVIASSLTKTMNYRSGVYYVDENNAVYGIKNANGALAPFPMSTIYHGGTPHPTSGARATQTVNFCHLDARKAIEEFDYMVLDCDVERFAVGLTPVIFVKSSGNKYKLVEAFGGLDRTADFGSIIADVPTAVFKAGVTAATYDATDQTLTITGTPELKDPSDLYEAGVKGIIQG